MKKVVRLTEADLARIIKKVIKESNQPKKGRLKEEVMAPQPFLTDKKSTFIEYLPKGSAVTDKTKVQEFVNSAAITLKNNDSIIKEFLNNKKFPLPKFIKIVAGTDITGSERANVNVGQARLKEGRRIVREAFKKSGLPYYDTQIESWITSAQNYQPSDLDKNVYDPSKVTSEQKKRFLQIYIYSLTKEGLTSSQIQGVEDNIKSSSDWASVDEQSIANEICKLKTMSDIKDLETQFKSEYGSLQGFLNDKLYDMVATQSPIGSWFPETTTNLKQRKQVIGCLNRISQRELKKDIAKLTDDLEDITIIM